MPCYRPQKGFKRRTSGETGKRGWTQNPREGFSDLPMSVPCGGCIGCRLERRRAWALRCMHEAQEHPENSYVTLTYDEDHLPENGSLTKTAIPEFIKRLRARRDYDYAKVLNATVGTNFRKASAPPHFLLWCRGIWGRKDASPLPSTRVWPRIR